LGIRRQYRHTHLSPAVIDWFHHHFSPGGFNGRFQIGFRRPGERGIWPLSTGDFEGLCEFLESMHLSSHLDYYITANAFSGVERRAEALFSLHNFVLDVDLHADGETGGLSDFDTTEDALDNLLFRLKSDIFDIPDAPSPTAVIYTGRGMQLWWHIVPMSIKCEVWYREIQQTLLRTIKWVISEYPDFAAFKVDGGASQNEIGYFRLPGTMNTVVDKPVLIKEFTPETYSTHSLIKWAKKWKRENPLEKATVAPQVSFSGQYTDGDIYILKNLYTTGFFRVRQMIQLRLLRDNDVGEETRNNMCFIVYNALLPALGHDKAWDKLLAFNEGFKQPMSEKELHQTIDTAHKKNGYKYRNETLITFLGVTKEEQDAIGLYVPSGPFTPFTKISPNASRNASKKTIKEDRDEKIKKMEEKGYSRTQIAKELNLNRDTVTAVLGVKESLFAKAVELFEAGKPNSLIGQELGASQRTIQRYRKKWKENADATSAEKVFYI